MSAPAVAPVKTSLKKLEDCVVIALNFTMGIGHLRQTNNLKVETTADKTQLRHQKRLIDSPELDEIKSQDGYMKRHLDSVSCNYAEAKRFLPKTELTKMYKALVAYQTIRRPKLVADFMAKYRALELVDFAPIAEALGDQFERSDYAPADEVEAGFQMYFSIHNVGELDLKGLPDFIVAMELEKEQTKRATAVDEWTKTMRVAMHGVISHLFDVLKTDPITGKKKVLRDTAVENLTEFCKTFPSRNLGDDAECLAIRDKITSLMAGVSPEQLRESENLKELIASKLETLKAEAGLLVQATGRKFR
jgi:hypothetical protein